MKNEQVLLEREIEVILQKQQTVNTSLQQKRETLHHSDDLIENGGNNTDTMTGKTLLSENSINTSITIQADPSPIELDSFDPLYSQWKGYGKRKRNRKYFKPLSSSSIKRVELNPTTDIFDNTFWFPFCKTNTHCNNITTNDLSVPLLSTTDTNNLTETTCGLSMLTTDLQVPVVTETTVSTIYKFNYKIHTASS